LDAGQVFLTNQLELERLIAPESGHSMTLVNFQCRIYDAQIRFPSFLSYVDVCYTFVFTLQWRAFWQKIAANNFFELDVWCLYLRVSDADLKTFATIENSMGGSAGVSSERRTSVLFTALTPHSSAWDIPYT
jgi:hypothetical protein